ncbi:MAG: alpha/beta hydrolase fold domain-containing protein [Verrucomicrobiota bacterium]
MLFSPTLSLRAGSVALAIALNFVAATSVPAAATAALPAPVPIRAGAAGDQPALYPFQAAAGKATGGALLIVPSSGTATNAKGEGAELARWLNERGVAGFVLRGGTAADVNRALQHLRAHAADLKISPNRIGLLGFGDGAVLAADAAYNQQVTANPDASDPVDKVASRPDYVALIWGSAPVADGVTASLPPTFLVGSSSTADGQAGMFDLWSRLRGAGGGRGGRGGTPGAGGRGGGARGGGGATPVDAHFFAKADASSGLGGDNPSLSTWPETFLTWAKFMGFLTDGPRVPLKGIVTVDGRTIPHGYLILTPVDFVGAGPIAAQILNSTAGVPLGQFSVAANLGAVPGRYRVDVRENMTRWISNSFTGSLAPLRGGTEEAAWFAHHRPLAPSVADQISFTKVRPADKQDYIIEIKPDAAANLDLNIAVFSRDTPPPTITVTEADAAIAGFSNPPQNPGQLAYVEQLKAYPPGPVSGIPEPILLWPEGAPGAIPDTNGVFTDEDKPALYAFPAPANNNTGAAVLVLPGGAFTNRGMDNEGVQVAKFLNRHGVAGFVLRYRLSPNYPNRATSTLDAHRAMQYLRAHAAEFKISPDRIGTIGFSAGSELEGDAFFNSVLPGDPAAADPLDRISTQANFNILIYGGRNITPAVAATAPPTFMFNTLEDAGHLTPELSVFNGLRAAGVPVEAHWYQVGPHGTSMSLGDPQLGQWPELMAKWLKTGGWLAAKPAAK